MPSGNETQIRSLTPVIAVILPDLVLVIVLVLLFFRSLTRSLAHRSFAHFLRLPATDTLCTMGRNAASKKKCSAGDESGDNDADDNTPFGIDELTSRLADRLISTNTCESEEAASVSAAIVEECYADATPGAKKGDAVGPMATLLAEYFEQLSSEMGEEMARSVLGVEAAPGQDQSSDEDDDDERPGSDIDFSDDGDDDGGYIGEGECELCEREIKLTRHHLIPKTTWSKFKNALLLPSGVALPRSARSGRRLLLLLGIGSGGLGGRVPRRTGLGSDGLALGLLGALLLGRRHGGGSIVVRLL